MFRRFRRRARADREFRDAQRACQALLQMHTEMPWPGVPGPVAATATAEDTPEAAAEPDFLPPEFRAPSRQDVAGFMMPWDQPLVINGEIRECPDCGAYRHWVVLCMRDDSVWLRCRAGHTTRELGLDAAWYNRHSGPADHWHPTLEDGLRHLGHCLSRNPLSPSPPHRRPRRAGLVNFRSAPIGGSTCVFPSRPRSASVLRPSWS